MKGISRRQKLVGGVLAIVSVAWTIDMFTGGPGPSLADAAPLPMVPSGPTEPPPDPTDLEVLIDALQREQAIRIVLPFEQVTRDLFVPTEHFEAVLPLVAVEGSGEEAEEQGDSANKPALFETRHELQGVLTGRVPLALIDGVLLQVGAEIDGYRLVEIHPDFVVLRQGRERVVRLQVAPAGDR